MNDRGSQTRHDGLPVQVTGADHPMMHEAAMSTAGPNPTSHHAGAVPAQRAIQVLHPAIVQLADGTATMRRIITDRPRLTIVALQAGVPPQQIADAMGLNMTEFRAAVSSWAAKLTRDGVLPEQGWDWIYHKVFGPAS